MVSRQQASNGINGKQAKTAVEYYGSCLDLCGSKCLVVHLYKLHATENNMSIRSLACCRNGLQQGLAASQCLPLVLHAAYGSCLGVQFLLCYAASTYTQVPVLANIYALVKCKLPQLTANN